MNPRVSRSSRARLEGDRVPDREDRRDARRRVPARRDPNDITGATPASFEPTLDYVVIKIPRFAFEKFPEADRELTSTMKSVGEVMAIGRTFKEAFGKAWRGLEKAGADLGGRRTSPVGRRRARRSPEGHRGSASI